MNTNETETVNNDAKHPASASEIDAVHQAVKKARVTSSTVDDNVDELESHVSATKVVEPEANAASTEDAAAAKSLSVEDVRSLTIPALKALLKERKLPVSGSKAELIERLTAPPPEFTLPREVSFEWDPTTSKHKFSVAAAPSGRSNCIRCLRTIAKGFDRVSFDHWGSGFLIQRHFHLECFALYPPAICPTAESIVFEKEVTDAQKKRIVDMFRTDAGHRTSDALAGVRAENTELKERGLTTQQALAVTTEKIRDVVE
jgi:hypothetical protein